MRTDANNNPTAFDTEVAHQAGLILGTDYAIGDPFLANGRIFHTARLLGDPITITVRVINAISFYTHPGAERWVYIGMPKFIWTALSSDQQRDVIGFMYQHEGGTAMRHLFPNYGQS